MRAVYALITVFLVFCVFFTRWYLCDVRGLCAFADDKFTADKTVAIVEMLLMLLIAFLIGFAVAWLLRENTFRTIRQNLTTLLKEKSGIREQLLLVEKENQLTRKHLADSQQEIHSASEQKKMSDSFLRESQTLVVALQGDLQLSQRRYENLKQETDTVRDTATQLKKDLEAEKSEQIKVVPAQKKIETVEEPAASDSFRSRFTPSTWQTKDDLTLISGIGPVIQRKLNELGIYSFQQISELTPELVDRVSRGIKFFPDRIGRDNWIGQAAALMRRK